MTENAERRTSNVEHSTTSKSQFEATGDGLLVRAPGKINLSLLVAGKREDGYHDIESIMAKIDWFDELLIEKSEIRNPKSETSNSKYETPDKSQLTNNQIKNAEQGMQNIEEGAGETPATPIELICRGSYQVPEGEDNLVYKAAKEILKIKNRKVKSDEWKKKRLKITLTKNMPAGSGLGSGSSDAAATLMGINKFLKLGMGKKELAALAAQLGSDVAFFLDGPMALCTGRGEKVKKLEGCEFRVFLIVPNVSVSTKRVYGNYRHNEVKYGLLHKQINEYIRKKRIDLICDMGANMLQESCFELHPELGVLKKRIESMGVRPVCLSGSGSSVYCIINNSNEKGAKTYRERIEQEFSCRSMTVNNNSW